MPRLSNPVRTTTALLLLLAPILAAATATAGGGGEDAGRSWVYGAEGGGTVALDEAFAWRLGLALARDRTRLVLEGEAIRASAFRSGEEPLSPIGSTGARVTWEIGRTRSAELRAGVGARLLGLFRPDTDRFTFFPEAAGRIDGRIDLAGPLSVLASVEVGLPAALVDARAGLELRLGSVELGVRWREYHRRWWRTFRPEWELRGLELALSWIPGRS